MWSCVEGVNVERREDIYTSLKENIAAQVKAARVLLCNTKP